MEIMKHIDTIKVFFPQWNGQYQLLDCGDFLKVENFGGVVTIRPEPQAVWKLTNSLDQWKKQAHVIFEQTGPHSGRWLKLKPTPDNWHIVYTLSTGKTLHLKLALTQFKHVGLFPEQADNWEYLSHCMSAWSFRPRVLNLFAYTGAASVVARMCGAEVYHVDAIKQVITWANENQRLSGVEGIRWVVEDAMKFVKRLHKRGEKFHGIIMDPPAFGHGPNKETWKLEKDIRELLEFSFQLLDAQHHFFILNTYSLGFSSLVVDNLLCGALSGNKSYEFGEVCLRDTFGKKLPLGVVGRFCTK